MKLVVLTGSSRGLGNAMYNQLLSCDHVKLVCVSKNVTDEQLNALKSQEQGFDFISSDFTLSAKADFEEIFEKEINKRIKDQKFNEIVFVNNSSVIEPIGMVGHLNGTDVRAATNINFLAPMLISQVLVRTAEKVSAKIKIVNISSGAAKKPIEGWSVYCATKSAVMMFFDVMSSMPICEVVHVDPGVLNTDMQRKIRASNASEFPHVESFKEMDEKGLLADPLLVAQKIIEKNILS